MSELTKGDAVAIMVDGEWCIGTYEYAIGNGESHIILITQYRLLGHADRQPVYWGESEFRECEDTEVIRLGR